MGRLTRRSFLSAAAAAGAAEQRRNVLFIVVDDLRPELGCYGHTIVKSPNIDKLAGRGVALTRAYCQQAVCGATRASFLTGKRPDSTQVYENRSHFLAALPDATTLPAFFRRHGYETRSLGKVFHEGIDDPKAWSVPPWPARNAGMQYIDLDAWSKVPAAARGTTSVPSLTWTKREARQAADVPDNALQDGQVAERAAATLRELRGKPFFLAVGFQKPHLPFVAPSKYFDLYRPDDIPAPPNATAPKGAPEVALHPWVELRGYSDIPAEGPLPPGKARELLHGYYAATSYMDAQVGKVLDELHQSGLAADTMVVLFGDHGWHLGEHNLWAKTTNFELDTRVPLILAGPGIPGRGARSAGLVELVDLYPTLGDLCGLKTPQDLEGVSMAPLLRDPRRAWKKAAFSQFPRPWSPNEAGAGMGYSMRTERYRYTEWRTKPAAAAELYDHNNDPHETVNIADTANRDLLARLRKTLHAGWRAAMP